MPSCAHDNAVLGFGSLFKMPNANLMNALEQELETQVEEACRPPFSSVDAVRDFISNENPSSDSSVSLEMCVIAVKDSWNLIRVQLIDYDYTSRVEEVLRLINKLDVQRRYKFVFSLTLWKAKKVDPANHCEFEVGRAYTFAKVHGLRLYYALTQGSSQLQINREAEPLSTTDEYDHDLQELQSAAKDATVSKMAASRIDGGRDPAGDDANPSPKKKIRVPKVDGKKK
ncbi:hypothetical protein PPTG_06348 [Phytophthora nicotianae INRA-310]|uniref:Uncharacterized protein n=3 Tax=Phytophthora nicotianae TaxID=4792 RepID=W2QSP4_PHYN3|nr:hypothetical protein PPTG_06348 [Phytophthora nicotianae INRA-310]ETN16133.1 hypothetical protein PPTG_06348 [Phytophthora nicotianae INRA-310]KUF87081.1 hypothetical protein AM587_10001784 [Phytophthora nicotianae]